MKVELKVGKFEKSLGKKTTQHLQQLALCTSDFFELDCLKARYSVFQCRL